MAEPNYRFPIPGYRQKVDLHHGSDHGGSDLFAPAGTPVVAMVDGVVVDVGSSGPGGFSVTIRGVDGRQYYYAHLREAPHVKSGQRVTAGHRIGSVGETGNAKGTGPHLHIGIGPEIQSGVGPKGGTGRGFDAVTFLSTVQQTEQGGGPKVMARVVAQEDSMDGQAIIARLTAKLGAPSISNRSPKTIKNPDPADLENPTIPNPDPVYRYLWPNGAYVDVHASGGENAQYEVRTISPKAATALEDDQPGPGGKPTVVNAPANRPNIVTKNPDGTTTTEPNPNYVPPAAKPGAAAEPNIVTRDGVDYEVVWQPAYPGSSEGRWTYVPVAGQPTTQPGVKTVTVGRRRYRENPDGSLTLIQELPQDAPQAPYRSPEQIELDRLKLEEMRREAIPAASRLIQDSYRAIAEVEQMLVSGKFGDPTSGDAIKEAERYKNAIVRNAEATLRGTTVAAEEAKREANMRADRVQGETMLTNRMQQGVALTQGLLGAASKVLMPRGATSLNFDPAAAAEELVSRMGGGKEMTDFARNLLLGARGQAPGQAPPGGPIPDLAMASAWGGALPGQPSAVPPDEPGAATPLPQRRQDVPIPAEVGPPPAQPFPVMQQPFEEDPMRPTGQLARALLSTLPGYARPGAMTAI